jgi:hypothetical protein
MTNGDLAAHIQKSILSAVESTIAKSLEPVLARVNETQQTQFKSSVESQMEKLSSANKDFGDWKPEMIALAKSHRRSNSLTSIDSPKPPIPPSRAN